ncbi:hypothetical protein ACM79C_06155 [Pseudomonas aeruginosa]|uniref:hypothetical protein n=1 Tax=Pseudomonas aeruginosa TaxID=287 RepID=UPI001F23B01A|nr:hypothetical protein [Pseudomonas aeruginosa]MDG4280002.1 hypothetical protein [Pseudomonas aeruginosa]HBO3911253.1 hypothetical protein [Pseudomonas aeruginosa]
MLNEFFAPYLKVLYGAAYNIHQTLEGLGITSSSFIERAADGQVTGGGWSPAEAVLPIFGALILLTALSIPVFLGAGYTLGKKMGAVLLAFVLVIPGILNILGLLPGFILTPERFVIGGSGVLGEALGYLPISLLGVLAGWCFVVIIYDTLKFGDRFRHYYDHLWFLTAILTGFFFVVDSGSSQNAKELEEATGTVRNASLYLLGQVREYDLHCQSQQASHLASCRWASRVQQQLNEYAANHYKIYNEFGPKESRDIYAPSWGNISDQEILLIRSEIEAYNKDKCPVVQLGQGVSRSVPSSGVCQRVPASYCTAFPDPPEGLVDKYTIGKSVAVASECIVPTLVNYRHQLERLETLVDRDSENKNYRWSFFVLFSVMVGGRIANSTTRVVDMDLRPDMDRRRLLRLISRGTRKLRYAFISAMELGVAGFGMLRRAISPGANKE